MFYLCFQISDVIVQGQTDATSAKEALLLWSRRTVEGYPGVHIKDFTHSWRDGKAFLSILHRHRCVGVLTDNFCNIVQRIGNSFQIWVRKLTGVFQRQWQSLPLDT